MSYMLVVSMLLFIHPLRGEEWRGWRGKVRSCNSRKPGGSDRYHSDKTKDMTRFILSGP